MSQSRSDNRIPVPFLQQGHSKIPFLALQLLDFCLSILTLCSSYMEVPTYLSLKSSDSDVGYEQAQLGFHAENSYEVPFSGCEDRVNFL